MVVIAAVLLTLMPDLSKEAKQMCHHPNRKRDNVRHAQIYTANNGNENAEEAEHDNA